MPLGQLHEHSFETVNSDSKFYWQLFKRKDDSPEFAEALKRYLVNYDSWHLNWNEEFKLTTKFLNFDNQMQSWNQ